MVKDKDKVRVDYICMEDNTVIGTSIKKFAKESNIYDKNFKYEPLTFQVGKDEVIPGFEKVVLGMQIGEEKTVAIAPHEAYGHYDKKLVKRYPRVLFEQQGVELEPGIKLNLQLRSGTLKASVLELDDKDVVLDMNHEYAGKTLIFKVILREIL